jgi:hypothetical protein
MVICVSCDVKDQVYAISSMGGEGAVSALLLEVRLISTAHDTDGFESEPVTDVHIIQALETSLEVP